MWARGDIDGIKDVGIPVYARGLIPNSPEKHGHGEIGLPISLGGEPVAIGDTGSWSGRWRASMRPHADFCSWLQAAMGGAGGIPTKPT